jgi:voltage-gated potassium channel
MQTEQTEFSGPLSLRKKIYELTFNDASNTGLHQSISRFIFILIVLNLLALLLESAPVINAQYQQWFYAFDFFSVIVFLFEYLLRVYVAPEDREFSARSSPRLAYATSPIGMVDLLAILPFLLGLFVVLDSRILRALRLLRILKFTQVLSVALKEFKAANQGRSKRQKIHALLFPSEFGGRLYGLVEMFLIFWIVLSALSIVFESVESINLIFRPHFFVLDALSFIVFATEYTLRVYAYPEENLARSSIALRYKFMTSFSGLLDLVAILPFMLELLLSNFIDLRFLRIIRMTRLFKLGRYSSASDTMFEVIKKETPVLMASSFVMGLLVFIMAAFGYLLERDAQPDKFENIPQSIYWAVVTLASVGYGDISPVTPAGRLVTVVLVLVGIGIFAIPAAIMASGFTDQLRLNREQVKMALLGKLGSGPFDGPARDNLIALARDAHLTQTEINELTEQLESRGAASANASEHRQRLTLAATNPEYALAQYRTLLSKMRELVSVADTGSVSGYLEQPDEASELEKNIWQQLIARKPGGTP